MPVINPQNRRQQWSSLAAMLQNVASRFGGLPALEWHDGKGWRRWSYAELAGQVKRLGIGLIKLGVAAGDRVAIVGPTSHSWLLADLSLMSIGAVVVPIYPTL